ncbi:MAG: amidohydrolase family protein [Acidobacteriota bacterium]
MRNNLILFLLIVTFASLPGAAQSKVLVIRNARVVTVSGAPIERGTIVISDGRITAVGTKVAIPAKAEVIDATGLSVYPGLIDAGTVLGLTEVSSVNATVDTTELGDFNPNMKALSAVNPHSELIPVGRMNGVTSAVTCPQGGIISGQCAMINLLGWTPEQMKIIAPAALHVTYPQLGFRSGGGFGSFSAPAPTDQQRQARDRQVESLRNKLDDALAYHKARQAAASDKNLPAREIDLALEALIPVIKGEVPVMVSANEAGEIKGAIDLADKYKLRLIINGGDEAVKHAKLLRERNIPVILGGVLELPGGEDAPYDQSFARAAELHKAGVKFAFTSGGVAYNVRLLPYHAGTAAAFGLPREEALKGVTLYPAQIFGVEKQVGSIEVGKMANLVITDGDILEFRTKLKRMFVNGEPASLGNRHTRLYEQFKDRK